MGTICGCTGTDFKSTQYWCIMFLNGKRDQHGYSLIFLLFLTSQYNLSKKNLLVSFSVLRFCSFVFVRRAKDFVLPRMPVCGAVQVQNPENARKILRTRLKKGNGRLRKLAIYIFGRFRQGDENGSRFEG